VREVKHSPEKVWQALTDPAQILENVKAAEKCVFSESELAAIDEILADA